jgi:hypothetical protein
MPVPTKNLVILSAAKDPCISLVPVRKSRGPSIAQPHRAMSGPNPTITPTNETLP